MVGFLVIYIQEFNSTNDEEAAVLAASRATSTVIDAASAIEVSRYARIYLGATSTRVLMLSFFVLRNNVN